MTTSRAFDLALFVGAPANPNDAAVVASIGPPFVAAFKSVALSSKPGGVVVGASMPGATAKDQILISGPSPNFDWSLTTNPAAAASVPPPTAQYDIVMANATPAWIVQTPYAVVLVGKGVQTDTGGVFEAAAKLVFTPSAGLTTKLDGGDPNLSRIDGFSFDLGTF